MICAVSARGTWLDLLPLITPFSLNAHRNASCRMALLLQARSTQAASPFFRVEISWDGSWEGGDAEIKNHLKISVAEGSVQPAL